MMIVTRKHLLVPTAVGAVIAAWLLLRPAPIERARRFIDQGDPASAAEVLLKQLAHPLPPEKEFPLRNELARALVLKGAYDAAETETRRLLQIDPKNPDAARMMGLLFFAKGQDAFAIDSFETARKMNPSDPRPAHALMILRQQRGDYAQARQEALSLLNSAPGDVSARLGLGRAELSAGLFQEAIATLETALQADPRLEEARLLRAHALLGAGRIEQAEEALAPLLKERPQDIEPRLLSAVIFRSRFMMEEADDALALLFTEDPRRLTAGLRLARSLAGKGDEERAQALLLDMSPQLPRLEDIPAPPPSRFDEPWETLALRRQVKSVRAEYHRASAALYKARYLLSDAEKQVRLALQLDPMSVDALQELTNIRRLEGNAADRLQTADQALTILPHHPQLILDKAEALLALGRTAEALLVAQSAAAACPSLARAQGVLADVYTAQKRLKDAADAADRALALNPRDPVGYLARGGAQAAAKKWKESADSFALAATLDPLNARAHWERARALAALKKNKEALAFRERALALEPRVYAGKQ